MALLLAYDWPGNVRELMHVVERAAVLCGGEIIDVAAWPDAVRASRTTPVDAAVEEEADAPVSLREATARLEKRMILAALERAKGNRSEAARQLGIGRPQLYVKMEEHGIAGRTEKE